MKVIINNNENEIEARHITIELFTDLEFRISINKFKELVIQKKSARRRRRKYRYHAIR
jgi:hypothetical protein